MMLTVRNSAVRTTTILTVSALALLGFVGCKSTADPQTTPSAGSSHATPSSSASATPDAIPSATPTPTREPGIPIGMDCNTFLSPQTVYNFNPNTSLQPAYKPKPGSDADEVVSFSGIACGLVNNSSGAITSVSVAHPAATDLAALKSAAAKGTAVSGIGDTAWFSTSGGTGQLQVFKGPFWITASSVFFGTANDARQLVGAAVATVK